MYNFDWLLAETKTNFSNRLNTHFSKIWVQGHQNSNNVRLVFTIFKHDSTYFFEFLDLKNIRIPKNSNTEEEANIILMDFISRVESSVSNYLV